jgi:hypothetical protein
VIAIEDKWLPEAQGTVRSQNVELYRRESKLDFGLSYVKCLPCELIVQSQSSCFCHLRSYSVTEVYRCVNDSCVRNDWQ